MVDTVSFTAISKLHKSAARPKLAEQSAANSVDVGKGVSAGGRVAGDAGAVCAGSGVVLGAAGVGAVPDEHAAMATRMQSRSAVLIQARSMNVYLWILI